MSRHNRDARGVDQLGTLWRISYQPDWLEQVKVTRTLENGRQSTKTLFRNPERTGRRPGPRAWRLAECRCRLEFRAAQGPELGLAVVGGCASYPGSGAGDLGSAGHQSCELAAERFCGRRR